MVAFWMWPGSLRRSRLPPVRLCSCNTNLSGSCTHAARPRTAHSSHSHTACMRVRPPSPSEPGSGGTAIFSARREPGRRTAFASRGPGWGAKPGIQSCVGCITGAWLGRMQGTRHPHKVQILYIQVLMSPLGNLVCCNKTSCI